MTVTINLSELPACIEEAIARAKQGDEIVIVDGTTLRAKIVPCDALPTRKRDMHPGAIEMADDFDDPLPEEFWTGTL